MPQQGRRDRSDTGKQHDEKNATFGVLSFSCIFRRFISSADSVPKALVYLRRRVTIGYYCMYVCDAPDSGGQVLTCESS